MRVASGLILYNFLLHSAAVWKGFIPVLLTADKIQSKYPAAARVGINPSPTVEVCCKCFIISGLQRNYVWLVVFVTIDNAATFVRLVSPSTATPPHRHTATFIPIRCR